MPRPDDPYWSLDIPGLTEDQAEQLLATVKEEQFGWFGSGTASDPSIWLTLHLDRATAQMLYDALMSNPETERGLAEPIGEWLQQATNRG